MPEAARPNHRWSPDFLSDTLGASRRFRILAVNDDCCPKNLCLMADTSISGARVARELDALVRIYGKPTSIVSDNGKVHQSGHLEMGERQRRRVALHRPGQAAAECLDRVIQRKPARRAFERGDVRTAWTMLDGSSPRGATITTTSGRIHRSEIKRPQKRAGRLSNLRAPRPTRLPETTTTNMKTKPADSRYE